MKLITSASIDELIARAAGQARRRLNLNVHESPSDPIQRLFVAAVRGSYFRPHRHSAKSEFAVVIRGRFDVVTFDDAGCVLERHTVGPGAEAAAFEMPANTWHSWIPLADDAVFLEVKQGPYDPQSAAEFAGWSPAEGTPQAAAFAERLQKAKPGECVALAWFPDGDAPPPARRSRCQIAPPQKL